MNNTAFIVRRKQATQKSGLMVAADDDQVDLVAPGQRSHLLNRVSFQDCYFAVRTGLATFSVKKIVAALDLSPHSEATARYAFEIARTLGASLVLVHVYEPIQMNEFTTEEGFRVLHHERQVMQQA